MERTQKLVFWFVTVFDAYTVLLENGKEHRYF